ncbi:MAG: glycosyltransferase [Lentisphaeria bacterium]|nr:glycosyltransferase [Lentisphaeria bacterium]
MDRLNREHQIWGPLGIRIHCHNGLNIKFPATDMSFHLKVTALNNGISVLDCDVPAAPRDRIYRTVQSYNIPWQVEIRKGDGKLVFLWHTDLAGRDVCLQFLTESLGDVIAWMAVADKFHNVYNSWMTIQMKREFIPLFAALRPRFHFMEESAFKADDYDFVFPIAPSDDEKASPVQYSRVNPFVYAQNVLTTDNPLSIPPVVEQPPSASRPAGKYVCLLREDFRADEDCLDADGWEAVAAFLRESGFETVTLSETSPLLENLSLLQGADFVVGVESPLLWLAWAAKKEVVQLVGTDCENRIPMSEFRVTLFESDKADEKRRIDVADVIGVIKVVPSFLEEYRKNHPLDAAIDFSVLVPVHNGEKTLKRCFDSILKQTCGNFELIACNDGSTDNTKAILAEYAKQDSRVRLLDHPINQGRMVTRRELAQAATKAYSIWVDCDDEIETDFLETANRVLSGRDCDIAGFRCELRLAYSGIQRSLIRGGMMRGECMLPVFVRNDAYHGSLWGKAVRTSLMKKCFPEGFEKLLQEDMFVMLSMYEQATSYIYVPSAKPMYIYYGDTGEWSSKLFNMTPELFDDYCRLKHEQIVFAAEHIARYDHDEELLNAYVLRMCDWSTFMSILSRNPAWRKQGVEIFLKWFCKEPGCLLNDGKVKLPGVASVVRKQLNAFANV